MAIENKISLINIIELEKDRDLFNEKKLIKHNDSQNINPILIQFSFSHPYSLFLKV
tara:strand:- start:268 stop:435 length:168 start_codon:yes stop_codon:yes gene_type:complete